MLKYNPIMTKYYQPQAFLLIIFSIFIAANSYSITTGTKNSKPMVVIIDPGHGGKDPGAVNKGIREKDIVLGIGLKLGKHITDNYPDIKVVYTRSTDVFVPLIERSRIANKNKADLFISLHANHCGTPATRGTETFVLGLHRSTENLEVAKKENSVILLEDDYTTTYEGFDPNLSESYIMFELVQDIYMDQSLLFADAIQNQFKNRLQTTNRGVKQAGFLVLRQSSMPSVLVEAGFLSNQAEANYLNSEEGQRNIALSIFEAFRKIKGKGASTNTAVLAEATAQKNNQTTVNNSQAASEPAKAEKVNSGAGEQKQIEKVESRVEKNAPEIASTTIETIKPEPSPAPRMEEKQAEEAPKKSELQKTTPPNSESANSAVMSENNAVSSSNSYFSVQIGANTTPVEPIPANFKGLKGVRREKEDKYYRYFVGKESSIAEITPVWQQIKAKFPQSFLVSFVDGKRIIVK